jgi:integrase
VWHFRKVIDGTLYNKSTGFDELKLAVAWSEDFVKATREGNLGWDSRGIPTVKEFFDTKGRDTTYDKWILPFVKAHAHIKITQITNDTCRAWIATRLSTVTHFKRPFSPNTVRTECAWLRAFFSRAVGARRFLRENPWAMAHPDDKVKVPKGPPRDRKLEIEEEPDFLAALDTLNPMVGRMARIVISSGLRRGEICGLQPAMILRGALHLPEWLTKGNKPRTVPVVPEILAMLEAQRVLRGLDARAGGPDARTQDRLFPINQQYFAEVFQKACRAARIAPTLTPHDLRRTYASRMAFKVPPKVLMLLMGHSDLKVTMAHYVDVKEAQLLAVVTSAGRILAGDGRTADVHQVCTDAETR